MKLLDQCCHILRVKHYAYRTEQSYVAWIERFIRFHGIKHPNTMGAAEVEQFLTHLAVDRHVSASTQNQALNALVFLYRDVLKIEVGRLDAVRARRPVRVPLVLSVAEVSQLLKLLQPAACRWLVRRLGPPCKSERACGTLFPLPPRGCCRGASGTSSRIRS